MNTNSNAAEALKPCPNTICDYSSPVIYPVTDSPNWRAFCDNCNAEGATKGTEAEAITAWNTRASTTNTTTEDGLASAIEAGKVVLEGRGDGTYSEAETAIELLLSNLTALSPSPSGDVVEALQSAQEALSLATQRNIADPNIVIELRALCERVGYGNVMSSASELWRSKEGTISGSEFCSGPCRSTTESALEKVEQALTTPQHTTSPDALLQGWYPVSEEPPATGIFDVWLHTDGNERIEGVSRRQADVPRQNGLWRLSTSTQEFITHWRIAPPPPDQHLQGGQP